MDGLVSEASALPEIFLGRQPILNRHSQLFAYELLFRNSSNAGANSANFLDGDQATATVVTNAFAEFSMSDALGPYQGFIKVDQGFLMSDLIFALPPHVVVLELTEHIALTPETLERCNQLRTAGHALAMRYAHNDTERTTALQKFVEVIKVDLKQVDDGLLPTIITALKPLGKTLLVEKVETLAQFNRCKELGFELFQGYFFAQPLIIQGKHVPPSQLTLLHLLGLLCQDADISAIEKAFKQEPVLTVNLLRLTNSAASGLSIRISSLRHAITLLGRRQLLRWLQLLLYSSTDLSHGVNPLLQLAATRGRLMELLADRTGDIQIYGKDIIDQAYMTGILSLIPSLLGYSMQEAVGKLPLEQRVLDALIEHNGTLGNLLKIVEAFEAGDTTSAQNLLANFPEIDPHYANSCLTRAMTWANNLSREQS